MAITNRTRKFLWGRSGNRCAICKIELVPEKDGSSNVNVGEECHIVSSKSDGGPRHRPLSDFDAYENLILLCSNHHTIIDQDVVSYPEAKVLKIKSSHESWVKETIDNKVANGEPKWLVRITSGKELVDIIKDVYGYRLNHDDVKSLEEAERIGNFLDILKEWGEASDVLSNTDYARISVELGQDLMELEKMGYIVFGERTTEKMQGFIWDIANVKVVHESNPTVIKIDLNDIDQQS